MRKAFFVYFLLFFCCSSIVAEEIWSYKKIAKEIAKEIKKRGKENIKIAVMDFTYYDKTTNTALKDISESLGVNLTKNGINIFERNQIDKILEEKKIQLSGIFESKSISELATFLGADAVLTGTVEDLPDDKAKLNVKVIDVKTSGLIVGGEYLIKRKWKLQEKIWIKKSIYKEGEYYYSVGQSKPFDNERDAKDDAYINALNNFVNYCGVNITSLNRIYESYSTSTGGSQDIESAKQSFSSAFVKNAEIKDVYIESQKKGYIVSVLVRIPESEYKRIQEEKDIKISMDVLLYYEDRDGVMKILNEGDVLNSGDKYAIYLKPSDAVYVYVYQIDELGKAYRLFPNENYHTPKNPIMGGRDLWIPSEKEVFELDETIGKERIYIFASKERISEFEGNVELTRKDIEPAINKMGPSRVVDKINQQTVEVPRTQEVTKVAKKLQAKGNFVYETWFWHK